MRGLGTKVRQRIEAINNVINQYGQVTIRQIYYRLVGTLGTNYRQIQYACSMGRKEGLISKSGIVDRSRPIYGKKLYDGLSDFLSGAPNTFSLDFWKDSEVRPEIWSEKDALSQVLYDVARDYNVDVYVTRGFLSDSNKYRWGGANKIILYFGDFDPSGLYIDQDLEFSCVFNNFTRKALTQDQIEEHKLPSVQVNKNDPRSPAYLSQYGNEGWELDALEPNLLKDLVKTAIEEYVTFDVEQKREEERNIRERLYEVLGDLD